MKISMMKKIRVLESKERFIDSLCVPLFVDVWEVMKNDDVRLTVKIQKLISIRYWYKWYSKAKENYS